MDVTTKMLDHIRKSPYKKYRPHHTNWSLTNLLLRSLTPGRNVLGIGILGLSILAVQFGQDVLVGPRVGMAATKTLADRTNTITAPHPDSSTAGHYAFGVGDTVAVTVVGHTDLSGQFPISLDGAFRHPFAGAIRAAGRTWEDVERDLLQKLNRLLAHDVRLSVDVAVYRPVYVIGDVIRPGEVAYTPGLTTLTAMAKAGGVPSVQQLPPAQIAHITEAAMAERELRVAETELTGFLIRRASLDTALSDQLKIAVPAELEPITQSPLIAELLARETAVLEAERTRVKRSREITQNQIRLLENEIAYLANEQSIISAQAKTIDAELQRILKAAEKGLITSRRVLDFERFKTDNDGARFRVAAAMSRARQQRVELEKRQRDEEHVLKQERLRQRLEVESEIERARARIHGARTALAVRSQAAVAGPMASRPELAFTITRIKPAGQILLHANTYTPLLPGDVLEVRMVPATAHRTTVANEKVKASTMPRPLMNR